jgi:hypothetical protein
MDHQIPVDLVVVVDIMLVVHPEHPVKEMTAVMAVTQTVLEVVVRGLKAQHQVAVVLAVLV